MIHHGRAVCQARKPNCEICPVLSLCPFPTSRAGQTGRKTGRGSTRRGDSAP
jgi:adenine-specific DNA glycosylase